ncbi:MAG: tetratricopeptide repeat protein [Acidobacteriota bacterium]
MRAGVGVFWLSLLLQGIALAAGAAGTERGGAGDRAAAARLNQEGNTLYAAGENEKALERYTRAMEKAARLPEVRYNRGNALYRLGRLQEAGREYQAAESGEGRLQRDARFNEGNALLAAGDYEGAARRFRQVLLEAPQDDDARRNLEISLSRAEAEQKQQNRMQETQSPSQEDGKDQDAQSSRQGESSEKPPSHDPQEQQQEGQKQRSPRKDSQGPPPPGQADRPDAAAEADAPEQAEPRAMSQEELGEEEARRLLQALSQDERSDLKEMMQRPPAKRHPSGHDW